MAQVWPPIDWPPVSSPARPRPPAGTVSALQRAAVAELLRVSPVADELGARFAEAGHELHLVGGSVRDALLGRLGTLTHPETGSASTVTWTSPRTPARSRCWGSWTAGPTSTWDTGIDFGTVGVAQAGLRLEITTFRSDQYDGLSRNPAVTYGDTLEGDLLRRDFAVNAMAVSVPGHRFADPFGGLAQLGGEGAGHARTPRSCRSATTRCACSAPPGSPPSWASRRRRGWSPR